MTTRAESAAATGRALLEAASGLLDEGGPDAVTLRAVGSKAGVSRGAPNGHFADKDDLLAALAIRGWAQLAADLVELRSDRAPFVPIVQEE
ncbi:MAG: TetR/AcrR family transcriptional regulator, partial [Propionibacteriaceae bacterium]